MDDRSHIILHPGDALIIVDVQNDFLSGGNLPVPGGNQIVAVLNCYIKAFTDRHLPIFATRDWHTPDHCSFKQQGGKWPIHCVANTHGAEFAPDLALHTGIFVISKGTNSDKDAYSAFEGTNLKQQLQAKHVSTLYIAGLATDVCVLNTVKDALTAGFQVYLLLDAVSAINVNPGDGEKALITMKQMGAILINKERILA